VRQGFVLFGMAVARLVQLDLDGVRFLLVMGMAQRCGEILGNGN